MIALAAAAALAAVPLADGQRPQAAVASAGCAFQLHLPPGAAAKRPSRYPLMIFLHGSGERGANRDQVKIHGPPKIAARDPSFRDDVVTPEGSFAMARAIRACGGEPRLTIYPDLGHTSWDPAYDDPALYFWLLAQRRRPHDKESR